MGVIGGIGCGLGYISPVSTLVKWFPDRRGMATGMAIMGFGGGAFLAGYLNVYFMGLFGVARTVMVLGVAYFIIMMIGARIIRRPPQGWKPAGWTPPAQTNKMITTRSVSRNARAGHGAVLSAVGHPVHQRDGGNRHSGAGLADDAGHVPQDGARSRRGGFASSASSTRVDVFSGRRFPITSAGAIPISRFFVVQFVLFLLIPGFAADGRWVIFEAAIFTVFTMYGGGFCHRSGVSGGYLRRRQRRRDSRRAADGLERRRGRRSRDHHAAFRTRQSAPRSRRKPRPHLRPAAARARVLAGRWASS